MPRSEPLIETVVHEAAHVIACLERGVIPKAVVCGPAGGSVTLPDNVSAEDNAVIAAAGVAAVQCILGDERADWSFEDAMLLKQSSQELGMSVKAMCAWAFNQAGQIIGPREAEIVELANVLLKTPNLRGDELRLAMPPMSCLFKYRKQFPEPVAPKVNMSARDPWRRGSIPSIEDVQKLCNETQALLREKRRH